MSASPGVTRALWVPVALVSVAQLHGAIREIIEAGRKELVLNVNAHAMNLAYELPWLRELFQRTRIVFCDGAGVMLALRAFGGTRVPERITYADWMWQLAELCAQHGYRLYLLGAEPGVADHAAERLRERFPALQIAGCHHGFFAKEGPETEAVISAINEARPQVLVVAFGMPIQEQWLDAHKDQIEANVMLTGGAVFDYVSGKSRRGPRMLLDHGGEWIARLLFEPRRLWRRYLIGNPLFMFRAWRWTRDHR
jgi:N-acetylglucosaminyldiphosphoundecaprenol N-acetyl-beta-D-mannosaminyltransferase